MFETAHQAVSSASEAALTFWHRVQTAVRVHTRSAVDSRAESTLVRDLEQVRDDATQALALANSQLESAVSARTKELADTAAQLHTLVRLAPVGIVQLDSAGGLLTANDQWLALSGLTLEQSRGSGWATAMHPEDTERVASEWAVHAADGTAYQTSLRFRTPNGQVNWVQVHSAPTYDDDVLVGHLASVTDVTALRLAEQNVAAMQARFEAAFASSPLGTAIVTLDGLVLEGNRRLFELTGDPSLVLNRPIEAIFRAVENPTAASLPFRTEQHAHQRSERQLRRGQGEEVWVNVSIAEIHEGQLATGLLYQLEDITARRLAEARVEHQAFHDSLTNLPNRLLLLERLDLALLEATRTHRGVGVLFLDLDRFKVVNDTLGHQAGDAVLVEVAERLQQGARKKDTVARIGGDEFVLVCPDLDTEHDLRAIALRMREKLARPISLGAAVASIDASIGIAFGTGADDPEKLLVDADASMYRVKDRAPEATQFSPVTRQRLELESALGQAVELGEIETWYQPIVDLQHASGTRVVATEALARWRRPVSGIVMPCDFIGIAEDTGLISEIGAAVLHQACVAGTEIAHLAVSVNVSARQFGRDDFGAVVRQALQESGLPAYRLCLELTESALVEAIDSAAATFQDLRRLGVRLAIDDFGTGYSSFTQLRAFTFDLLKIDMTFIRGIEESSRDRGVVEGILRLADVLQLDVIAEGIETAGQRDLLKRMGCRFGQGYFFSRPAPTVQPTLVAHR